MNRLLHYDAISEFKAQYFKDVLGLEHLNPAEIKIDKLSYIDSGSDSDVNFWGYTLEKNGVKYLLPSKDSFGSNLNISSFFPIVAKHKVKVAHKGIVYQFINKRVSAKIQPQKKMSFKQFVDTLCEFRHSHPQQRTLSVFIGLASMLDRCNVRICSPPGFGKDSVLETMKALFGDACSVLSPTLPKLEYRASYKWLVINEVIDIKIDFWRNIEQFLLEAGDFKTEITKSSRAFGNVGEVIDISKLSISLFYNDIDCYKTRKDENNYIDFIAKKAVLDRFVALRLRGKMTEDFNVKTDDDIKSLVASNLEFYKNLIHTFSYYQENMISEVHNYSVTGLAKMPPRWALSMTKILRVVDLYCDSQEEFNQWVEVINLSLHDYKEMTKYPLLLQRVFDKNPLPRKQVLVREALSKLDTFTDKNILLEEQLK